jgi:hypothetical protein
VLGASGSESFTSKRCCGTVRTISVTVAVVALQQCGSAGSSTNFCGANERSLVLFLRLTMSYKQKKFETPVELHRILGNKYVVGLEERKAKRKQVDVHNVYISICPSCDKIRVCKLYRTKVSRSIRTQEERPRWYSLCLRATNILSR